MKLAFCVGLQSKLDTQVPVLREVTHDHLREMIALAQGDWNDVDTIKALYQRYGEIRNTEWNLEKLFQSQD
ncbi:hypothetical protein HYT55_00540 [Candidatus Woesearchaeota archaeon]|nr:hypothetical protein [Candidatus Woesearchaeota archaeon]